MEVPHDFPPLRAVPFSHSTSRSRKRERPKKSSLPEYVLRATTVRVVVDPDAGEPVDHPMANAIARDNVEKALMEWGRLQLVMDGQESGS